MPSVFWSGAIHYTWEMRTNYLIIPYAVWLVGPEWLLAGTLILLAVQFRVDYRYDLQN